MLCSCKEENVVITAAPATGEEAASNEIATEAVDNNMWKMLQDKGTEFSNIGMEYSKSAWMKGTELSSTAWTSLRSLYPQKGTESESGSSADENAEKSAYNFCGAIA